MSAGNPPLSSHHHHHRTAPFSALQQRRGRRGGNGGSRGSGRGGAVVTVAVDDDTDGVVNADEMMQFSTEAEVATRLFVEEASALQSEIHAARRDINDMVLGACDATLVEGLPPLPPAFVGDDGRNAASILAPAPPPALAGGLTKSQRVRPFSGASTTWISGKQQRRMPKGRQAQGPACAREGRDQNTTSATSSSPLSTLPVGPLIRESLRRNEVNSEIQRWVTRAAARSRHTFQSVYHWARCELDALEAHEARDLPDGALKSLPSHHRVHVTLGVVSTILESICPDSEMTQRLVEGLQRLLLLPKGVTIEDIGSIGTAAAFAAMDHPTEHSSSSEDSDGGDDRHGSAARHPKHRRSTSTHPQNDATAASPSATATSSPLSWMEVIQSQEAYLSALVLRVKRNNSAIAALRGLLRSVFHREDTRRVRTTFTSWRNFCKMSKQRRVLTLERFTSGHKRSTVGRCFRAWARSVATSRRVRLLRMRDDAVQGSRSMELRVKELVQAGREELSRELEKVRVVLADERGHRERQLQSFTSEMESLGEELASLRYYLHLTCYHKHLWRSLWLTFHRETRLPHLMPNNVAEEGLKLREALRVYIASSTAAAFDGLAAATPDGQSNHPTNGPLPSERPGSGTGGMSAWAHERVSVSPLSPAIPGVGGTETSRDRDGLDGVPPRTPVILPVASNSSVSGSLTISGGGPSGAYSGHGGSTSLAALPLGSGSSQAMGSVALMQQRQRCALVRAKVESVLIAWTNDVLLKLQVQRFVIAVRDDMSDGVIFAALCWALDRSSGRETQPFLEDQVRRLPPAVLGRRVLTALKQASKRLASMPFAVPLLQLCPVAVEHMSDERAVLHLFGPDDPWYLWLLSVLFLDYCHMQLHAPCAPESLAAPMDAQTAAVTVSDETRRVRSSPGSAVFSKRGAIAVTRSGTRKSPVDASSNTSNVTPVRLSRDAAHKDAFLFATQTDRRSELFLIDIIEDAAEYVVSCPMRPGNGSLSARETPIGDGGRSLQGAGGRGGTLHGGGRPTVATGGAGGAPVNSLSVRSHLLLPAPTGGGTSIGNGTGSSSAAQGRTRNTAAVTGKTSFLPVTGFGHQQQQGMLPLPQPPRQTPQLQGGKRAGPHNKPAGPSSSAHAPLGAGGGTGGTGGISGKSPRLLDHAALTATSAVPQLDSPSLSAADHPSNSGRVVEVVSPIVDDLTPFDSNNVSYARGSGHAAVGELSLDHHDPGTMMGVGKGSRLSPTSPFTQAELQKLTAAARGPIEMDPVVLPVEAIARQFDELMNVHLPTSRAASERERSTDGVDSSIEEPPTATATKSSQCLPNANGDAFEEFEVMAARRPPPPPHWEAGATHRDDNSLSPTPLDPNSDGNPYDAVLLGKWQDELQRRKGAWIDLSRLIVTAIASYGALERQVLVDPPHHPHGSLQGSAGGGSRSVMAGNSNRGTVGGRAQKSDPLDSVQSSLS